MKSLVFVFILSLFMSFIPKFALAQEGTTAIPEEILQYDIRRYNPEAQGVKDLVFELRMDNLTETLNKNLALGKLVDVHFKVYWLAPSEWRIEVNGLPKGFDEIKSDLKTLIGGKLEFVVSKPFQSVVADLSFEKVNRNGKNYLRAFDPLYVKPFTEILLGFDSQGRMNEMVTVVPNSSSVTTYEYVVTPWSNSKFLVSKQSTKSSYGASESTISHNAEYVSVNGFGFPQKLTIKTNNKITIPPRGKDKEKVFSQDTTSVLKFSKYEVNTGKAKRFIVDGSLK